MSAGVFVSATTTGAGKTTLTCGIARALTGAGQRVAAIKPIETGVRALPEDATALAAACGRPELADDPAWYRAERALSPYAAALEGEPAPNLDRIILRIRELEHELVLCEGAGGLLVPIDRERTIADLATAIGLPLLLVAPDRLGVLSDVLSTYEAAARRGLSIAAVALSTVDDHPDPSRRTNARILSERLPAPVVAVGHGSSVEPVVAAIRQYLA